MQSIGDGDTGSAGRLPCRPATSKSRRASLVKWWDRFARMRFLYGLGRISVKPAARALAATHRTGRVHRVRLPRLSPTPQVHMNGTTRTGQSRSAWISRRAYLATPEGGVTGAIDDPLTATYSAAPGHARHVNPPALFMGAAGGTAPVVIVFLFMQRYIVQGVKLSGIKG